MNFAICRDRWIVNPTLARRVASVVLALGLWAIAFAQPVVAAGGSTQPSSVEQPAQQMSAVADQTASLAPGRTGNADW